ncbi:hypothetical protein [Pseudolysobacter antarcticus]|uniref:hypothetical protein n=1 Tax=Pseudolysobacter antarcticus TaxID=2511995 RepID=UPI003CCD5005
MDQYAFAIDQSGVARPQGGACGLGAMERISALIFANVLSWRYGQPSNSVVNIVSFC